MILAQSSSTDLTTIVSVVLGVALTALGGLILWVLSGLNQRLDRLGDAMEKRDDKLELAIKEEGRQIVGVVANQGPLMWRVIGLENWAEKRSNDPYIVPRDMGWTEHRDP